MSHSIIEIDSNIDAFGGAACGTPPNYMSLSV